MDVSYHLPMAVTTLWRQILIDCLALSRLVRIFCTATISLIFLYAVGQQYIACMAHSDAVDG